MMEKLKLLLDKKNGYLQLDFMFAVFLFFSFVLIVYMMNDSYMDNLNDSYLSSKLIGYSQDLCFMLSKTPGYPINWEDEEIINLKRIGLKSNSNFSLSEDKLNKLTNSFYVDILENLKLNEYFNIQVVDVLNSSLYKDFGSKYGSTSVFETSVCYATYNNRAVKIIVSVWE